MMDQQAIKHSNLPSPQVRHEVSVKIQRAISLLVYSIILGMQTISTMMKGGFVSALSIVAQLSLFHHAFHRYLRQDLVPPHSPELGEYDDRDAAVIQQHLDWSRQANIQLWISSWWGPGRQSDSEHVIADRTVFLHHDRLTHLFVAC